MSAPGLLRAYTRAQDEEHRAASRAALPALKAPCAPPVLLAVSLHQFNRRAWPAEMEPLETVVSDDIAVGEKLPRPNYQSHVIERLANLPMPVISASSMPAPIIIRNDQ